MDDDWGSLAAGAARPTFSLFDRVSPEDAAKNDTFVDIIVYNRWSKAERRLYQRLKAERIANKIKHEELNSIDDITNSLNQLALFTTGPDPLNPDIENIMNTLNNMKLNFDQATKANK